jgi:hypothetical protein
MVVKINLRLTYDGEKWIAENEKIRVTGGTIEELYDAIGRKLKSMVKGDIKVTLSFDFRTLPFHLWQYASYYFSRDLYFKFD